MTVRGGNLRIVTAMDLSILLVPIMAALALAGTGLMAVMVVLERPTTEPAPAAPRRRFSRR